MPTTTNNSRFNELQKRLVIRNNFLKPSDFCNRPQLQLQQLQSKVALSTNNNTNNSNHSILSEHNQQNPSTTSKEEGVKETKGFNQESQENVPEVASGRKKEITKEPFAQNSTGENNKPEEEHPLQALARSIKNMRPHQNQVLPSNGYLPVAAPRRVHGGRRNGREYNMDLFKAPSHIELQEKPTFDDGVTEVSEITTDIRTLSTKGATYAEHRMAEKMKKMLANHQSEKDALDNESPDLEKADSYLEVDVHNLKDLSKAVERAKLDLQGGWSHTKTKVRHGLPYEETDYRAEGDDDGVSEIWDKAIRGTNGVTRRQSVDPDSGEVNYVRGPPTPRICPTSERIHGLIKETRSSDGGLVIDATEICDEDLDGVDLLDDEEKGSEFHPIQIDDRTIRTTELLGEDFLEEEEAAFMMKKKQIKASSPKRKSPRNTSPRQTSPRQTKQDFVDTVSETVESSSKKSSSRDPMASQIEARYIQSDSSLRVRPTDRLNNDSTGIYDTSVGFLKSFANQVGTQLKYIQRQGLITEGDMDGMLGVLEKDLEHTSAQLPKERDEMVLFLGEELEKSTCGANHATGDIGTTVEFPTDSVDKMLDSLRNTYQKSLTQCGVDKSMVNENAKAMENMVSSLKDAYAKAPLCDGKQDTQAIISSAVGQLNQMDKQATSLASAKTMTLMDDAAVGSQSFTNLVKRIQEQQQQVQNCTAKEGQVDKEELKQKSLESVDEMLRSAKEDQQKKLTKIAKLKQKRRNSNTKPKAQPQQTFIVPINMPSRKNNGYSEIE